MKVVAIIPARSGSVSVKDKNIVLLEGKPLIAYSIEAALACPLIQRVIVSTDSPKYAEISRSFGAETPFLRPASLSQNNTPDLPVFVHCLEWLRDNEGYEPDIIVHLRPTSPVRAPGLVSKAVHLLQSDPEADSVRAVCRPTQSPFKMWKIENGFLKPLLSTAIHEPYNQPWQELPEVFWQNGYIDVTRSRTVLEMGSMTGKKIKPLLMDSPSVIDIDDPHTLALASLALRKELP